jgi:hypothetical protein
MFEERLTPYSCISVNNVTWRVKVRIVTQKIASHLCETVRQTRLCGKSMQLN